MSPTIRRKKASNDNGSGGRGAAPDSQPSPLAEVARLEEVAAEERKKLRQVEREREEAGRAVVARREELVQARARGESGDEQRKALEQAEAEARNRFDVEVEAAGRRVKVADGEMGHYVRENLEAIGREKLERDQAARDRVVAALEEVEAAIAEAEAERQASDELIRLASLVTRIEGSPELGLERLKTAIRDQRAAGVRLPSARVWSPEDDEVTITFHPSEPVEDAGFIDAA
jgi:hypothetical protein